MAFPCWLDVLDIIFHCHGPHLRRSGWPPVPSEPLLRHWKDTVSKLRERRNCSGPLEFSGGSFPPPPQKNHKENMPRSPASRNHQVFFVTSGAATVHLTCISDLFACLATTFHVKERAPPRRLPCFTCLGVARIIVSTERCTVTSKLKSQDKKDFGKLEPEQPMGEVSLGEKWGIARCERKWGWQAPIFKFALA